MDRRRFLRAAGASGITLAWPGRGLAATGTEARLVLVILRGALDGLAAVPPTGDPDYRRWRGALVVNDALEIEPAFGLHPALEGLYARYRQQELLVLHAAATPYRERSHFDGQDLLEAGIAPARDGWLNRALIDGESGRQGIALGTSVPLALRGAAPVTSWAPSRMPDADEDTLQRLGMLYANDPLLSARLEEALAAADIAGTMGGAGVAFGPRAFEQLARAAGRFLAAPDGPRVAVLESTGWDSHANQGADSGVLANRLRGLDRGLDALATALADAWSNTAVLVVTEFGRTVAVNGTNGTDHGTASCAFLLGGAVAGGRLLGDWPGLARRDLYEGRDLRPTTDLRSLFKGVLHDHLGVTRGHLEDRVFPDSRAATPLEGLLRA